MKGKLHTHTKNLNLGGASKLNHLNYHLLVIKLFFQRKYTVNDRKNPRLLPTQSADISLFNNEHITARGGWR